MSGFQVLEKIITFNPKAYIVMFSEENNEETLEHKAV
jgi:hypothetical protein